MWERQFPKGRLALLSGIAPAGGGFVLAGSTYGVNSPNRDVWLIGVDSNGQLLWRLERRRVLR
jgi:hypothetical protein